nr:dTDP-4-keto-6-deoxy-D-glucose epimerase [uncultured bacterium]
MDVTPMSIDGAYRITPERWDDDRGCRYETLEEHVGRPFRVAQVSFSVSRRNTVRGIHATTVPPGQGTIVTCVRGRVLAIAVDLRVGSPTFGCYDTTDQDESSGVSVYVTDGIGHAFLARTEGACLNYLWAQEPVPDKTIEVDALDPALNLPWRLAGTPIMSAEDRDAPTLAEAAAKGLLPTYEDCLRFYAAGSKA